MRQIQSINFGINDWRNQIPDIDCTCQFKCVAYTLSMHWREDKKCYPSQRTLAEEAGVDPKTVRKALNFFEEIGLIKRKKLKIKALSFEMCEYEFIGVGTGGNTGGNGTPEIREIRELRELRKKDTLTGIKKENPKIRLEDVSDWETLFSYWEQNKQGGKYKNQESRTRMLDRLKELTSDNFELAKEAIVFCVDNKYQGFTDGSRLYYRSSEAACGRKTQSDEEFYRKLEAL